MTMLLSILSTLGLVLAGGGLIMIIWAAGTKRHRLVGPALRACVAGIVLVIVTQALHIVLK